MPLAEVAYMRDILNKREESTVRLSRRQLVGGALGALVAARDVEEARPDGLVMFRRVGCPWCHAWDREIGRIYPRTEIGAALPLREVDLDLEGDGGISLARPVRYTPTFVLVAGTTEVARIEGYPGDEFFWIRLEQLAGIGAEPDDEDHPKEDAS
jgi:hypothetical protein